MSVITKLKNTAVGIVFLLLGLSIGISLIGGALIIPFLPSMMEIVIGWILVLLSSLAALLALIDTLH